jgi:chemotaxis protein MotB
MNTLRLAAVALAAVATFTFSGCGETRTDSDKVLLAEQQRYIKELEDKLAKKDEEAVRRVITTATPDTDIPKTAVPGATHTTRGMVEVFTIENSILFRPGSADLSTSAKSTLNRVAALVKEKYVGYDVRVVGHTDNQVITRSKDRWDDNWDLAGGRAQKVLHYLLERGVPAKDLGFAGYADQRPVASNASDATRQKNRRVEILVVPKETGKDAQ